MRFWEYINRQDRQGKDKMSDNILQRIKDLQLTDKPAAELLLLTFLRATFPLDVQSVELRPLAVSLNSFNGFMRLADGKRLFFKTHTEPDNVIGEYYNAAMLAKVGYPIIQPLYSSTEAGKQLLIYEVIDDPSVFDVAWAIEQGQSDLLPALTKAQNDADDHLLQIYLNTLEWQSAEDAAKAPIHQLFYHRLAGGRLQRFYDDTTIILPNGQYPMREVRAKTWVINGQKYDARLDDLIARAIEKLTPHTAGASVAGHGDAHNGNVFFKQRESSLLYFDPAFAGRHHPLLDLVKPLFHNVFAMWMYFPQIKKDALHITLKTSGDEWQVEHDYVLHPVRHMFLRSKGERVLIPVMQALKQRGWLSEDWRAYLKLALFCCPFLTMNLTDQEKFSPEISLLGLTMAVEMGAESKRSLIDSILDEVAQSL
jgi:Phosphotransferase enzyme family